MCGYRKPAKVFLKNPAQHYSDLNMLSTLTEFEPSFTNNAFKRPKDKECVRVDGAADEGPSHLEVQFWWTRRHLEQMKAVTLVTSRSSATQPCRASKRVSRISTCEPLYSVYP